MKDELLPAPSSVLAIALALIKQGRFVDAARLLEPAYHRQPKNEKFQLMLGIAVSGCGHAELAADLLDAVAKQAPHARHPAYEIVDLLGARRQEAIQAYFAAALERSPHDARLLEAAANWLDDIGQTVAAKALLQQVIRQYPERDSAHIALALAEANEGSLSIAEKRLMALLPRCKRNAQVWANLGTLRAADGRCVEAIADLARAHELNPHHIQISINYGMALLKSGRLQEGWHLFNRRLSLPGHGLLPPQKLLPVRKRNLLGKTVLVTHDSGLGDTIQFTRYLPLLAETGARVLLWVPLPLRQLLSDYPGVSALVQTQGDWPTYDWHCPIMRLAEVFGTSLENIPFQGPYLTPSAARIAIWRDRLPPVTAGRKRLGLVWAGSAREHNPRLAAIDRRRSINPVYLKPFLDIAGIDWISLQLGGVPFDSFICNPMPHVVDLADTAAIISVLDGVVSVDTAVAHLAGALGKPVYLLDRYDNCWRWLTNRVDSPWYPNTRIYRQPAWGDWGPPIQRIAVDLELLHENY